MSNTSEAINTSGYLKLARLQAFLNLRKQTNDFDGDKCCASVIKYIFKDGDLDYRVPNDAPVKNHNPDLLYCTALDLAINQRDVAACKALLDLGADFTMKNGNGQTALRTLLETCCDERDRTVNDLVNVILDAQVASGNGKNPRCNDGVSHLHMACAYDNTDAVRLLLDKGSCVNERVRSDFEFAPNYTPLHLAVIFSNSETIKLLLERGADEMAEDDRGLTPLHVAILRKVEVAEKLRSWKLSLSYNFQLKDHIARLIGTIKLLTPTNVQLSQIIDRTGLTPFHVHCAHGSSIPNERIKSVADVNVALRLNSPIFPGYTALHFAAHFGRMFETLVEFSTDIFAKDAKGITPLDIWLKHPKIEPVSRVVEIHSKLNSIKFTDGTKLSEVLRAMCDVDSFHEFVSSKLKNVNNRVSLDSPLWPGYTILHLIVLFGRKAQNSDSESFIHQVMGCAGQDCRIKDANGRTAIELATNLENPDDSKFVFDAIVQNFARKVFDSVNRADSGYTFLAVCSNKVDVLERCLTLDRGDINSPITAVFKWYGTGCELECDYESEFALFAGQDVVEDKIFAKGSTPLHIAVILGNLENSRLLLEHGADPTLQDDDGMTPMYLAFLQKSMDLVELLLSESNFVQEIITCKGGLSNLHIACSMNDFHAIELLSKLVKDLNDHVISSTKLEYNTASSFLQKHAGDTPLHFAVEGESIEAIERLMELGASALIKNAKGLNPLHLAIKAAVEQNSKVLDYFFNEFQQYIGQFQKDFGWTTLHLGCAALNKKIVEAAIKIDDVNARIPEGSPIFPGCTALHLLSLIKKCADETLMQRIVQLLYDRGADPGIANADGQTPLHVASNYNRDPVLDILVCNLRDFNVNPTDNEGLSHFHIACSRNSVEIVEDFVKNGANIQQSTDHLSSGDTVGYTPLHFAARTGSSEIFKALLAHGADPNARDAQDRTPLQIVALYSSYEQIEYYRVIQAVKSLEKLDVLAINMLGESLLESILKNYSRSLNFSGEIVELLLLSGSHTNCRNPVTGEHLLLTLFEVRFIASSGTLAHLLERATDLDRLDEISGQSAIHLAVSNKNLTGSDCVSVIHALVKKGCDVDHQDNEGKTALHVAVEAENSIGLTALLKFGSNVNIVDNSGNTAFEKLHQRLNAWRNHIMFSFAQHVHKLVKYGFRLNEANERIYNQVRYSHVEDDSENYAAELDKMRHYEVIKNFVTLYDVFSGSVVYDYPTLPTLHREQIYRVFNSSNKLYVEFRYYIGLLYTRYREARKRLMLIGPAQDALNILAGFGLPEPCSEGIVRYLENDDLSSLVIFGENFYSSMDTIQRESKL